MSEKYSNKYFLNRIRQLRRQISSLKSYKTIEELFVADLKTLKLSGVKKQQQGNGK